MKLIFTLILLFSVLVFSQAEFVPSEHLVYSFLERMSAEHLIKNYESFYRPLTRKKIAEYLSSLIEKENVLSVLDKNILNDFKSEFELEIDGTLSNSQSFFVSDKYALSSNAEKYLYFKSENKKFNIFINLVGDAELYSSNIYDKYTISTLGSLGGSIRGTILDKFGFYLKATNGVVLSNKKNALVKRELSYNFKLNENYDESFFDETEGHLSFNSDFINFKIGRDRQLIGHGIEKELFSNYPPKFDYFSFNFNYDIFSFSYFHGKLLGELTHYISIYEGIVNKIEDKFIAYHRIGFDISNHLKIGFGEIVIYANRSADLSYINPFNFYKSIEHANRDRDNALLFFDFSNNSFNNVRFFLTLLIDDIKFSKIGSGWYGNQTMWNFGIDYYDINSHPIDFHFQYIRVEPYVFSHRILSNNFTNLGYNLGIGINPNSDLLLCNIFYRINYRTFLSFLFSYQRHGANHTDGIYVIKNVGGDINYGHRTYDNDYVKFLDGDMEYYSNYGFNFHFEPFNNIFFRLDFIYETQSLIFIKRNFMKFITNLSFKL